MINKDKNENKTFFERGITLISLIITIIILLILVGVIISMTIGNGGIIGRAKDAVDKYKKAQKNEETMLNQTEDYLNEKFGMTDGSQGSQNVGGSNEINTCTINISDLGNITVRGITNMKTFMIYKNNQWLDTTKENEYALTTNNGETANIYVVAVDQIGKIYKSNVVTYTNQIKSIPNPGDTTKMIASSTYPNTRSITEAFNGTMPTVFTYVDWSPEYAADEDYLGYLFDSGLKLRKLLIRSESWTGGDSYAFRVEGLKDKNDNTSWEAINTKEYIVNPNKGSYKEDIFYFDTSTTYYGYRIINNYKNSGNGRQYWCVPNYNAIGVEELQFYGI